MIPVSTWRWGTQDSTHIVSQESEHYIQEEQPDLVIDAILHVINEVRH